MLLIAEMVANKAFDTCATHCFNPSNYTQNKITTKEKRCIGDCANIRAHVVGIDFFNKSVMLNKY